MKVLTLIAQLKISGRLRHTVNQVRISFVVLQEVADEILNPFMCLGRLFYTAQRHDIYNCHGLP